MKKILSLLCFTLILSSKLIGQNQANNWYFGYKAGLTFNTNPPSALLNGQLSTGEGSASISDQAGNILFYTDGITVYNRNHLIMPNGTGLLGNPSAAQSAIIVPKPGSFTNFYIITVPENGTVGMRYSEVDITLDGGMGDLLVSNKNTFMFSASSEKVTVVKHANGFYYWVIGRYNDVANSKKYISFLIDCNGVNLSSSVISDVGINNAQNWGYLVASPDGTKLASASSSAGIEVADFDDLTGVVSNTINLGSLNYFGVQGGNYGVSFSPNSKILYASSIHNWALVQWDLNAANIPASEVLIGFLSGSAAARPGYRGGALQLGPDGKIYIAHVATPFLGVINNPNVLGIGCDLQNNAVDLQGRNSILGLPPFIQSYFNPSLVSFTGNRCSGEQIQFSLLGASFTDSVRWDFDDPTSSNNTSLLINPTHIFNNPGTYNVRLLRFLNCITDTIIETVVIHGTDSLQQSFILCPNSNFTLPDGQVVSSVGTYTTIIPMMVTGCDSTITTNLLPPPTSVSAGIDVTICNGTNVQLQALQASSFVWTPATGLSDAFISNPIATPTVTTIYTVVGTDLNGCVSSDQITVNVNPLPTINAGIDQTICINNPVTLAASGGTTYVWDNGVIDGTAFNPTATTTYTVTGTDANGCVNTDQVVVTVNPLPVINAGIDQTICVNDAITLSGSGGVSYVWDNSVTDGTAFNPTVTTTYTVIGTDANGCTNTDQVVVNVNPLPIVNAGIDQTICLNDPITLTASGAVNYVWDNGITNGVAFNPTVTTTYTVTGTDVNGCVNTDQVVVTVNSLPAINAGSDQTICINDPVTLAASGGATYVWDNSIIDGTPFNPTATATYTVTGTDANGCVNTDQVVVTVNPLPVIDAGIDQTICINDAVTLSGAGGVSYVWDNSVTDGTAFNPTVTTTYTVIGTDANGCTNTDQVVINVNPLPIVNAGIDQAICLNDPVTLSGSGAVTYVWDNSVIDGIAFNPTATSTYKVTGTDANGCVNTDLVTVIVNPLPVVNAGLDQTICINDPVTLNASGAATYVWDNSVTDGIAFNPMATTTYTVTGTDANGCVNTDQVEVVVNPLPIITFDVSAMQGCVPMNITYTSTGNYVSCDWLFGDGTAASGCGSVIHTYTNPGCYSVTLKATSPDGCVNQATTNNIICIPPNPIADFTTSIGYEPLNMINASVDFFNSSAHASSYLWNFGTGITSTATSPTHTYPNYDAGEYPMYLVAYNSLGCSDTAFADIVVEESLIYYVPNAFTPNGDQYNSTFKPVFTAGYDPADFNMYIFDRWGELIFESHDAKMGWDGTYANSGIIQDGIYTWKIDFKLRNSDKRKAEIGHVTLMR